MKIEVDSKDLHTIADQIEHNCNMLSYTDAEDAEDDVEFYVPVIKELADDLRAITNLAMQRQTPGGAS